MEKIKIFTLDLNKIRNNITYYTIQHLGDKPVLLMNQHTIEYLKELASEIISITIPITDVTLCGSKIAIANWIPFGEVEIR